MSSLLLELITPVKGRPIGFLAGLFLLLASPARAQAVFGLGTLTSNYLGNPAGSQGVVPINPVNGEAGNPVPVTGVLAGQSLVGMDFRPANGQLYALGYDSAAVSSVANAQLYTLNTTTGTGTLIGSAVRLELGRRTARIGFDFNPVADLIRVVSSNRANYRLSPTTGAITGTDTDLAYASGTPAVPGIGAVAYTNSLPGATSTTLYAFDELNNGLLSIVSPPNSGMLTAPVTVKFGIYGIGSPAAIDIDIYSTGTPNRNEGFLTEVTEFGSSNLYRLDLTTGQATLLGNTVPRVVPFAIRDIAVGATSPLATAPASLAQLASLYPNPSRSLVTLRLPASLRGNQATAVTITDAMGRVALTSTLPAGSLDTLALPLANLAPGVYSVLARTQAGLIAKRLVVQ